MNSKHPTKVDELPDGEFYAILTPESVTIPGDERSRTNPGHGYPEHSVDYWCIETFTDKAAWVAEVQRLKAQTGYYRTPFKAVMMRPAKVTTSVTVDVET